MTMSPKNCAACGTCLRCLGNEKIQLGKTGWILGDIPNLLSGALDVDIYVCPECHKLELYMSDTLTESSDFDFDSLPQKTCPRCGAVHDFDYPKCPKCKYEY